MDLSEQDGNLKVAIKNGMNRRDTDGVETIS